MDDLVERLARKLAAHTSRRRLLGMIGTALLGYRAGDESFHMAPQSERRVVLEPITSSAASDKSGRVSAMNSRQAVNIEWLS